MVQARGAIVSDADILTARAVDLRNAWPTGQRWGAAAEFAAHTIDHTMPAWH